MNIDSAVSLAPDGKQAYLPQVALPDQKDDFSEVHIADKDDGNDQVLYSTGEEAQAPGVVSGWKPDRLDSNRGGDDADRVESDGDRFEETDDGGAASGEFPG